MSDSILFPSFKDHMAELVFDARTLREKFFFKAMLASLTNTRETVTKLAEHPQVLSVTSQIRKSCSTAAEVINQWQESKLPRHLSEVYDGIKRLAEHPAFVATAEQLNEYTESAKKLLDRNKLAELTWQVGGTCKFIAQLALHPRRVGAICPSGPSLAERMAGLIPEDRSGYVIEFGAGTGAVTRAILERGIDPDRFIAIEYSRDFCEILAKKFPGINIVHGDAAKFASYIPEGAKVSAVVSSLPLINLPKGTCNAIIDGIKRHLHEDGCVIQFTYALWGASLFKDWGYRCDASRFAALNLPPARIDRFRLA